MLLFSSFDLVKDDLGAPRSTFPHTVYFTAGTQAASAKQNYLAFVRLANLGQGRHGKKAEGAESESDSEDDSMSGSDDEDEVEEVEADKVFGLPRMHYRWAGKLVQSSTFMSKFPVVTLSVYTRFKKVPHDKQMDDCMGTLLPSLGKNSDCNLGLQPACALLLLPMQDGEQHGRHQPCALLPTAARCGGGVGGQRTGAHL